MRVGTFSGQVRLASAGIWVAWACHWLALVTGLQLWLVAGELAQSPVDSLRPSGDTRLTSPCVRSL